LSLPDQYSFVPNILSLVSPESYRVSYPVTETSEKWHDDCVGAKKKQGEAVMCWGMVMWGWKGPFFVWVAETPEEREHAT